MYLVLLLCRVLQVTKVGRRGSAVSILFDYDRQYYMTFNITWVNKHISSFSTTGEISICFWITSDANVAKREDDKWHVQAVDV